MVEVQAVWQEGLVFKGISQDGYEVVMEGGKERTRIGPAELLLVSLAGCTGMDVVYILNKMRVPFKNLTVKVKGEREKTHPKRYTRIDIEYIVEASEEYREKILSAIRLSQEKYCTVSATIQNGADINFGLTIVE